MVEEFTFTELFAGVGGFSSAFEHLGGKCLCAVEIEAQARQMYRSNYPTTPLHQDVRDLQSLPKHDILTGGFPCQPFSRAGKQPGFKDTKKGTLFHEIVRLLKTSQPSMILLENVSGLLNLPHNPPGQLPEVVRAGLESAGYSLHVKTINSSCVLPQIRQRCYIVGFHQSCSGASSRFAWPVLPELNRSLGGLYGVLSHSATSVSFQLTEQQWHARLDRCLDPHMWLTDGSVPFGTLRRNYRSTPGRKAAQKHLSRRAGKRQKMDEETSTGGGGGGGGSSDGSSGSSSSSGGTTTTTTTSTSTSTSNGTNGTNGNTTEPTIYTTWEEHKKKRNQEEERLLSTPAPPNSHSSYTRGWNNLISTELDWETELDDRYLSERYANENPPTSNLERNRLQKIALPHHRPRFLTHREASRLMGFPSDFSILREDDPSGPGTALFGNAITPPIIGGIVACMLRARRTENTTNSLEGTATKEEQEDIGSWDCVGTRVALNMALNACSGAARRRALMERIKALSLQQQCTAAAATGATPTSTKDDQNCCYRFRDSGTCAWGDKCKYIHEEHDDV
jgi:DNA-cytosine methyltransferase